MSGFSWSFSHIKNFSTCPKRYFHYQIAKDVEEPESDALREGNELHKAFELRLLRGAALPAGMGQHETLLSSIERAPGKSYGELKLAITSSFKPCAFFARDVWCRVVIDAAKIADDYAIILDYKTGKPSDDILQLQLMAAVLFHHQPQLQRIRAALVFVNHDHVEKAEFVRSDLTEIWAEILPRVKKLEQARQQQEYPPKPSGLCKKYCAVVSCPYYGKGGR